MTDLIALIHAGQVSLEEGERIFDDTIDAIHRREVDPGWPSILGFSEYEATAYLHGATLEDVVRLRYDGWPTRCYRCNIPLDYRLYGWFFEHTDDGSPRLTHIECPQLGT